MIPYGKQEITKEDEKALLETLHSSFITQGPKVAEFEKAIAKEVSVEFAVAFNSATSALHCACLALGLREGDWLWSSPISFVASSNCGIYCGAKIDFVDINPKTYNLDVELLEKKLKNTKKSKLPKVLVAVHFAGQSCDMEAIYKLSLKYGFKIIEDASHALGGKYRTYPIGCCKFSDISIFSFHPVKIITSAEGGMATCKEEKYAKKMQMLRSHGITKDAQELTRKNGKKEGWYYEEQIIGFNYRMSDLHASLGLSQLTRLKEYVKKRNEIARIYDEALEDLELITPKIEAYNYSAYHLYPILLTKKSGIKRKKLFDIFHKEGILVQVHYIPIHLQPFYARFGFKKGDFKNAENYYKKTLSLPLFPSLKEEEQKRVIEILKENVAKK
ncbi:UDP-4-amino-4,6-dideoxy-N-acetyl-beta-L-altrosamine transaminase [Helicobacter valdiviensis]|uniref:UDP-4-amino-4,6-dideoxy-N-acetyl-beta-L-altrosamine transaminase n=1 Tax=Helicobacter valdiviensis TaxID=1458358 RepID=A0A2W6PPT3_9HELI|nr:UDP-4-amino-4,6-dideoxy-N-acetyl-beta-L-altrosamine transaminase [Helicobacter valdiviensis]PZT48733.1 UDP-4-amino-4,6-dideoxy-N-acetyl-beta-L-altrosamine transaminase [Helicobacter valdiviensis]